LTIASKIGDNPLLILEARDRIGGRVFTSDTNIDMGAAWLHGSDQNPLNSLLDFNNLIPVSKCNPWMHSEKTPIEYITPQGNISEDKRQQLATKWNNLATKIGSMSNKTIVEAFEQLTRNNDHLDLSNTGSDECKDYESDDDLSSFLYMIEVWSGGSVKTLSTDFLKIDLNATTNNSQYNNALFGDYGGSHYLFKNGAKSLVDALINSSIISNLRDHIKCNQIVTNINYNSYYVEVLTRTGQVYYCDKLCITIPPGPLKNIIFNPPLDINKTTALSKLKMGSYKKIQIEFYKEDVFWKTNVPMFLTYNPKTNGANYYLNNVEEKEDICPYILWNNYKYSKDKPILESICPANIGWNLAGKNDEEIIEMMMSQLQNYYPVVPEPKA
jgi:monoamine oxidase